MPVPKPQEVVDLTFPPAVILRRECIDAGIDADVADIKLRTLDKVRYLISGSTAEAACRGCHRRAPSPCDMWPSAVLKCRARSGASSTVAALRAPLLVRDRFHTSTARSSQRNSGIEPKIPTLIFRHISIGTAGRNVNALSNWGRGSIGVYQCKQCKSYRRFWSSRTTPIFKSWLKTRLPMAASNLPSQHCHTSQRRLDQISSAGDRRDLEGQDGRLGGCSPIQRDRSRLSYRLHHRGGGSALALARCAQQHSLGKAVRASAACRCGFPSSQYWKRVATSSPIVKSRKGL